MPPPINSLYFLMGWWWFARSSPVSLPKVRRKYTSRARTRWFSAQDLEFDWLLWLKTFSFQTREIASRKLRKEGNREMNVSVLPVLFCIVSLNLEHQQFNTDLIFLEVISYDTSSVRIECSRQFSPNLLIQGVKSPKIIIESTW